MMNTMNKSLKRQGRVNRDPSRVKKIYQLEDIEQGMEILQALSLYRLMTNQQVAELLFRGWVTSNGQIRSDKMYQRKANESLNRLLDAGWITRVGVTLKHRITQNKYMTHLNLLTGKGAKWIAQAYAAEGFTAQVRWASSLKSNYHQTEPNHLVAINDALIHLTRAVWYLGGEVTHVYTDAQLKNHFRGIIPDFLVFVTMPTGKVYPLFGEIDRGSMTNQSTSHGVRDWKKKIESYGAYFKHQWRQHEFIYQLGIDPSRTAHPLVLILTAKTGRLNNLRRTTHEAGGGTVYWHTTLGRLFDDPDKGTDNWLAMTRPIWLRPQGDEPVSLANHLIPPDKTPS